MAKPPVFDRYTHERQKDLLKAEQDRLNSVEGWKVMGHLGFLLVAVIIFVTGVIAWLASVFR
jgi:hypothetical protein